MQNKLKGATIPTLQHLNKAEIRSIMATGDNMLTALSVGRKCGLIDPDEIVYLGDLEEDANGVNYIDWKISKDSEQVV
jgi:cation-transporting P-type ATPase 13A2